MEFTHMLRPRFELARLAYLLGECEFDYSNPNVCHGGKGGGSGSTSNTTTSTTSPPPQILQAYEDTLNRATSTANQPLQQYGGPTVAGFTPDQLSAFGTINNSQGAAQPYIDQSQGLIQQGTQPLWSGVQQFSPNNVNQYMSPYTNNVLNSTVAQEQNTDAQQQQALKGNAISSGAWGGDRAGVASAVLSGQQDLANNSTNAGILNQGYTQGLGEFNTQQQAQLGANEANSYLSQQGAFGEANLGNEALNTSLEGASTQLQSGALQQQLGQEALNVPYEQFLQQQAYPFQTTQYLSNIAEGIGGSSGGQSSTTSPAASNTSQLAGLGIGGLGLAGSLFGGSSGGSSSGLGIASGGRIYKRGGAVGRYAMGGEIATSVPDVSISYVPSVSGSSFHGSGPPAPPRVETPSSSSGGLGGTGLSLGDFTKAGGSLQGLFGGSSPSSGGTVGTAAGSLYDGSASDGSVGTAAGSLYDTGASDAAGDAASDAASDTASEGASDFFSNIFDFKRGGPVPQHFDTGGTTTTNPMTFVFGSGNGPAQSNVSHDNKWMSQIGDGIGTVVGSIFGGPAGGFVGGKAGADAGGTLGDLFGGNWKSLGSDIKAGPIGEDPIFANTIGDNNSAEGQGNSPQLGGNFSGTTLFSAYGNGSPFKRGGMATRHFDDGGQVGGVAPTSNQLSGQQVSTQASNLNNMTPEQLQNYLMRLPIGSQQQQQVSSILQQKRSMPNTGTQAQGGMGTQQQPNFGVYARGGFADGGDTIPDLLDPASIQRQTGVASDAAQDDTPPVTGGLGTTQTTQPAASTDTDYKAQHKSPNPWLALADAGFSMASGTSPQAGVNIARGAQAGIQNYINQGKEADSVNASADKLMQEAKQHKDTLGLEQQKADQMKEYQTGLLGNDTNKTANEAAYQQGELGIHQQQLAQGNFEPIKDSWGNVSGLMDKRTGRILPAPAGSGSFAPSAANSSINTQANLPAGSSPAMVGEQNSDLPQDEQERLAQVPSQMQPLIKGLIQGRIPPTRQYFGNNVGQALQAAADVDPTFDVANPTARMKIASDFSAAGNSGKMVTALNTASRHAAATALAGIDLNNYSGLPGATTVNNMFNSVESSSGDPRVTNYGSYLGNYGHEAIKVISGKSNPGEAETAEFTKPLDSSGSPEQILGALSAKNGMMLSRAEEMQRSYDQGMGASGRQVKVVSPVAQQAFQDMDGLYAAAKNGQLDKPESKAAIARLREYSRPVTSTAVPASSASPASIPPAAQRIAGQKYTNPNGVSATWTGSGWAQ